MSAKKRKAAKLPVSVLLVLVALGVAGIYAWTVIPETRPVADVRPGVVLCRYNDFSESTEQRERGFLETMQSEFPNVPILTTSQYLGTTKETSVRRARQLLDTYGDNVRGVFCVCEPNGDGMLQVLEERKLAGKVPFVTCDANAAMIAGLKSKKLDGIVLQDPVNMGRTAVKTMVAHLGGEHVASRIGTGQTLATANNADSEEIRTLLYPERFTGQPFDPQEAEWTIGVVTKGLTHEFWQSVRAGADLAASEAGNVRIRFEAPTLEQDLDRQIEIVRRLVEDGVSGICLSPIDSQKLVPVVVEAKSRGVPVVVFDSNLSDEPLYEGAPAKVSYVATDNYQVGVMAARKLAALQR